MAFPAILPRFIIMLRSSISFLFDTPFRSMKKATRTMLHTLFAVIGTLGSISIFCFESENFFFFSISFLFLSLRERERDSEREREREREREMERGFWREREMEEGGGI
jgi:hypothetical protein